MSFPILASYLVSGQAHVLLASERSERWASLRRSYDSLRAEIDALKPDLLVYWSTQWLSCLGYTVQADANPRGLHVDHNWHEFGTMSYSLNVDQGFAEICQQQIAKQGHCSKAIAYDGFPIDTGTIVANSLLNPRGHFPTAMVSHNFYAGKEETIGIGQAIRETLERTKKRAVLVLVSSLSNRYFTHEIDPREDEISSASDHEWNQRVLAGFESGSMSSLTELVPDFAKNGNADMGFKAAYCLAGALGENSRFQSKVFDYQPVWGTGNALIGIYPEKGERS